MDLENKYGTYPIQCKLLELLSHFDNLCVSNGISYSVSSGTLLGAVRNKGFIPWDDDVDVMISRKDYERLVECLSMDASIRIERLTRSCLWTERVRFSESDTEVDTYQPSIDLFILDNCPESILFRKVKVLTILMLQGMIKYDLSFKKGSFFMKCSSFVTHLLGLLFSHQTKYKWYCSVAQWGDRKPSRYRGSYHDQFKGVPIVYESDVVSSVERIPFENLEVYAFVNREKYLKRIYGDDYMTPPEESIRVPQHIL